MIPLRISVVSFLIACTGTKLETEPEFEIEPSSEPAGESTGSPSQEPSGEPDETDPDDVDNDGDGYSENEGDCLDSNSAIYPEADERCDQIDNDCDGVIDNDPIDGMPYFLDEDEDGYGAGFGQGTSCDTPDGFVDNSLDCDDTNRDINPDGEEVCGDNKDNNCDGSIDEGQNWYPDADGDGFGDPNSSQFTCTPDSNWVLDNTDCNDTDPLANPSGVEVLLDGIDQDCDGNDREFPYIGNEILKLAEGESAAGIYECDIQWSAVGIASSVTCIDCEFSFDVSFTYDTNSVSSSNCANVSVDLNYTYGYVADYDGAGNAALVTYNTTDESWSAWIDTSDGSSLVDFDGVNFTYSTGYLDYNYQGSYFSYFWQGSADILPYDNDGDGLDSFADCNDGDSAIGSTATDIPADGIDQDCDGVDAQIPDDDGDGYGNTVDCDDSDSTVYPGATEIVADGIDQDCDGFDVQVGDDIDSDGYDNTIDCDDNDANTYPGAAEIANDGIDQDCDGSDLTVSCPTGEMVDCNGNCTPTNWLGDGYCDDGTYSHNGTPIYLNCPAFTFDNGDCPTDYDADGFDDTVDCDDTDATVYPGATEINGDGIDQDCNGSDAVVGLDSDGDGVDSVTDCDDGDSTIYPGATEIYADGIDQDCDGQDATYTNYVGNERYLVTETGQTSTGTYPCDISWDVTHNTLLSPCTDCIFAFQLDFTYDSTSSTIDSNSSACQSYASDFSYDYGYVVDYDGAGNDALFTKQSGTSSWALWFTNGDLVVNQGTPATISLNNTQFTYSIGYTDYLYQGYYFTNLVIGSGTVQ